MKYLYLALSSIVLAYIIIVLFTYLYQRKLLYHPSENNYTGDEIQFEYKEVFIEVDKDLKLKSWFLEKDVKNIKQFYTSMVMQAILPIGFTSLMNYTN